MAASPVVMQPASNQHELERDALFKRLRSKPDNKMCFDCPARNPTWATVPYGCYLCLSCAGVHRSLGVHISFVRSTTLDSWTPEQLKLMAIGGNARARHFFKQHGWDELGADKIESKYTSRAAQLYRSMLEKEAAKLTPAQAMAIASGHSKDLAGPGELHDTRHAPDPAKHLKPEQEDQSQLTQHTPPEGTAGSEAASGASGAGGAGPGKAAAGGTGASSGPACRAAATAVTTKARLVMTKKGGGKPGLGVKKLDTKVDDALFDQAPAPEAAPAPPASLSDPLLVGSGAASGGAGEAAARASRFSYDLVTAEPNLQRGKDGHLTLHAKGSDDFFGNKASAPAPRAPSLAVASARPSGTGGSLAQQKFGSAKAISSRAFEDSNRESESEHQVRLSKFSGAVAISSSDYFGSSDGSGGGSGLGSRRSTSTRSGDLDSASRLVSQLSLKASSELLQMAGSASQAVGSVTHKLSGMATKFMSDLGRGY